MVTVTVAHTTLCAVAMKSFLKTMEQEGRREKEKKEEREGEEEEG